MIGAPMMSPPTGMMQPAQPPMIPNPAFQQWAHMAQAWIAEKERRRQEFAQACQLISTDAAKRFKIDIEADSTIAADEQAEKQSRTEFLAAITPFLEVVIPGLLANPALAPLAKELGMFVVRAYKVARPLEEAFETTFDALAEQAKNNPQGAGAQQKPGNTKSPMEIQTEAATAAGKLQVQQQTNQVKLAAIQAQTAIEGAKLQQDQIQHQQSLALEARHMQGQEALDQARISRIASRAAEGLV